MYPGLILLCGVAQIVLLYQHSPWISGAAASVGVLLILLLFAATRMRWNSHLDMYLLMLAPGGLGMMLMAGPACHLGTWSAFWSMSFGMLVASVPLCWWFARCIREARQQARGVTLLALDSTAMLIGMLLGHYPAIWLTASLDPRLAWLHHGLMLSGMLLGMVAAATFEGLKSKSAVWSVSLFPSSTKNGRSPR